MSSVIGVSANIEVLSQLDRRGGGNKHVSRNTIRLGGSSALAAVAQKELGGNPTLLALTGPSDDSFGVLLRHHIRVTGIEVQYFEVLGTTSSAVITPGDTGHSELYGERGSPIGDLEHALRMTASVVNGSFAMATSVRSEDFVFAQALLGNAPQGKRFIHLHESFCKHPDMPKAVGLADMMVLNKVEFAACGGDFSALHRMGPLAIVATNAENGGVCSFAGQMFRYDAVTAYRDSLVSDVGAGDTFNGALIHAMDSLGLTVDDLANMANFGHVVSIAADAAAQKVAFGEIRHKLL